MRKINVIEFISLDGVIQSPGSPQEDTSNGFAYGGWTAPYADPTLGSFIRNEMTRPFDLLLGRKTFEIWADHWPLRPDSWPNAMTATKYVASNTMTSHAWQPSVFLGGDIAEKIAQLKQEPGPDLHVYGSSELMQTLLRHDLVDAFWLKIHPITLGSGKRLFGDGTVPVGFKVTESEVSPNGVIIVNYERAGAVKTGRYE